MSRFPYLGPPFPYYKPYIKNENYPINKSNNFEKFNAVTNFKQELNSKNNIDSSLEKNKSNSNNQDYLFDLFGLKIYFDDILIFSLLFFLYTEGVKDDMLFIVLLLLLIS